MKPEVTREDVRRIIREYMIGHPPSDDQSDELDEFAVSHNFDKDVWDDVIGAAMKSGGLFFKVMMEKTADELDMDEKGFAEIPGDEIDRMAAQVCGAVAATFFMLGWEVADQVRGGDAL